MQFFNQYYKIYHLTYHSTQLFSQKMTWCQQSWQQNKIKCIFRFYPGPLGRKKWQGCESSFASSALEPLLCEENMTVSLLHPQLYAIKPIMFQFVWLLKVFEKKILYCKQKQKSKSERNEKLLDFSVQVLQFFLVMYCFCQGIDFS